jgi:hypothetical protein
MIRPSFSSNIDNGLAFIQEVGMRLAGANNEFPIFFPEQQTLLRDMVSEN